MKLDDHTAVGAALEVVLQLLTDHGDKEFLWDAENTKLWGSWISQAPTKNNNIIIIIKT